MNNDDHLIFEGYKKKSGLGLRFGMTDAEYIKADEEREKQEHKQFKKDYNKVFKKKAKSEDAETWGIEGKIKEALREVEGAGYTGDHIDPMEVAKLVVGHQGDWGNEGEYTSLVQALTHVIEAYYGKGLQDS